jgi:hypothetical protein
MDEGGGSGGWGGGGNGLPPLRVHDRHDLLDGEVRHLVRALRAAPPVAVRPPWGEGAVEWVPPGGGGGGLTKIRIRTLAVHL